MTGTPRRVLVVEDSPTQARQVALLLENAGLRADCLSTVAQGVEAALSGEADLIVVDVNLPDGTGFDLCRAVRRADLTPRPRILLITADLDPAHALRGLEAGADGFVSKLAGPARLLDRALGLLALDPREDDGGAAAEISFRGETFSVATGREQLLNLLVSAFDDQARAADEARDRARSSAATLASVLDTVPSGVLVTDPTGRPISANRAARTLLGLPPGARVASIPSSCSFVLPNGEPLSWADAPPARTSADGQARPATELRIVRADGSRGDVLVSTGAVVGPSEQVSRAVTSLHPITDLKATERELADSRTFLQATLDALAERVVVLSPTGHVVATNRGWREFAGPLLDGADAVDVGGDLLGKIKTLADAGAAAWQDLLRVLEAGLAGHRDRVEVELPLEGDAAGSWVLVRTARFAVGREQRLLMSVEDVSRRRQAEQAARTAERQLRELLERMPIPVGVVRWPEVLLTNAAAGAMFERGGGAVPAGTDLRTVLDDGALQVTQAHYHAALASDVPVEVPPAALRGPGTASAEGAYAVRVEFGGDPAVMYLSLPKPTDRPRGDSMLRADRMAQLGTLAAGVAHEINNPMTYVMASLDELEDLARACADELPVRQELLDRVAEARDGARRVVDIVRGLLTFGRHDAESAPGPVDVVACVEAAVRLARPELRYRATLKLVLDGPPPVVADSNQLTQVILNLLVNAAQAMPDNDDAASNRIEIRARTAADRVVVEVEDNGCGIQAHDMTRLFDPFFTTKPVGVGSGLGLSVSRNIVRRFGGEIAVETQPGLGTLFRVELPASTLPIPPRLAVSGEHPTGAATPPPGRRLLVVDDDVAVGRAVGRMLKRFGEVVVVNSGQDAVARLSQGERFDVILSDLLMPDMDGIGLCEWIGLHRPGLSARVVLLTGGAFTSRAQQFVANFPNECLAKPVTRRHLLAAVERTLALGPPPTGEPR